MRFLALFLIVLGLRLASPSLEVFEDGSWRWGSASGCFPTAICNEE